MCFKVRLPLLPPAYIFDHVIKVGVVEANLRAVMLVVESMEHHLLPERKKAKQRSDWTKTRMCKYNMQVKKTVKTN